MQTLFQSPMSISAKCHQHWSL